MDEAVQKYIDAVDPVHRPLFDRMHRLIMAAHPGAEVVLSYQIPTYKVGRRRLYVVPLLVRSSGWRSVASLVLPWRDE
jgi:hypothetical protein